MWTVRILLERGYNVRGTVRDEGKAQFVKEYFSKRGFGNDRLELVSVPDIVKEGAFDEFVKDVEGILHTASPFHSNVKEPEEFFRPAVQGTVGMLKSALKNGPNVKRIVVTSSTAAVMEPPTQPTQFSELNWNESAPKEVEEKGSDAAPMTIYRASKALAEKSAWKFVEEHKSEVKWDLSVINPPFIFGPPIHDIKSASALNTSLKLWYDTLTGEPAKTRDQLKASFTWVDVRDTALAHILALEKPEAGGERIITAAGPCLWQEWLEAANSLPQSQRPANLPVGYPDILEGERTYLANWDLSKEARILGIKFHSKAETTKDTIENFKERGW
ncbi:NAD(P)-binding protein [Agrocybe pediades]|nr:NAD(P)-binding protein [Agrocybe pediades]